ncbi:Serrate RNA effector molecule homolog [Gryllus bimaculatus]|nr:Serrate RNA effector molecule homolog [Gryllus bimaculatus]
MVFLLLRRTCLIISTIMVPVGMEVMEAIALPVATVTIRDITRVIRDQVVVDIIGEVRKNKELHQDYQQNSSDQTIGSENDRKSMTALVINRYDRGANEFRPVIHYRDLDAPREPEEFI